MKHFLTFALLVGAIPGAFAQDVRTRSGVEATANQPQARQVSGRVLGSDGEPLAGATVLVIERGSNAPATGTYTDANGNYTVTVANPATSTIRISFINFRTTDIPANSPDAAFNLKLQSEESTLDEVVVTGVATTTKRSLVSTSIASLSTEQITGTTRQSTLDQAISGKVPGALITQNTGAAGGGINIQLRGVSTVSNGNSQPLFVVDGVLINNSQLSNGRSGGSFTAAGGTAQDNPANRLADINPDDIASIDILKGPAAAAQFGGRGNAGVIIIRTKRGNTGKTVFNVSQDYGFSEAIRLLGQTNWTLDRVRTVYPRDSRRPDEPSLSESLYQSATAGGRSLPDYEKEVYGGTRQLYETRASARGGNEKTTFYIGLGRRYEEGIQINTDFQRNNIRLNLDQKMSDKIDLSVSTSYVNTLNNRGWDGNDNNGVGITYTVATTPNFVNLYPTGPDQYPDNPIGGDNPLAVAQRGVNVERTNRTINSATFRFRPFTTTFHSLSLEISGGADVLSTVSEVYLPSDLQSQRAQSPSGASTRTDNDILNANIQAFANYSLNLLNGDLRPTVQVGYQRLLNRTSTENITGRGLPANVANPSTGSVISGTSSRTRYDDVGYLISGEVNYKEQFIVRGGFRFDKTTLNSDPNKLYTFPQLSGAVNLHNFEFWPIREVVNQVKLRAAFGQAAGPPQFGAIYSPTNSVVTGGQGGQIPSTSVAFENISYERAEEIEFGGDIGLFNNRITLDVTYYIKTTKDFLNNFVPSPASGVAQVTGVPVGDLENKGWEISLTAEPVRSENITWSTTLNWWRNRSKITRLDVQPFFPANSFGSAYGRNQIREGQSPTAWVGTPTQSDGRLTVYGDYQPDFQLSWLNSVTLFKNFEFSMNWHWKKGGQNASLINVIRDGTGTSPDWFDPAPAGSGFQYLGQYRQGSRSYNSAADAIESSTYLRLREAALYYRIPKSVLGWSNGVINGIRVGVSGINLVTITDYKGYDPEVSNFGNQALNNGFDLLNSPNTRRILFHLSLDF